MLVPALLVALAACGGTPATSPAAQSAATTPSAATTSATTSSATAASTASAATTPSDTSSAAASSSAPSTVATTAASTAAGQAAAGAGGGCDASLAGKPGVIAQFCNGSAKAHVVFGSLNRQLSGGTCTTSAGLFVVNIGVVTDHTFQGPRPDFISVNTPPQGGGGSDTAATVVLDGKLQGDSGRFGGTVTFTSPGKALTFTGSGGDGGRLTIDVTC